MSLQYGELWPTNSWDLWGHPSKFQRVSHLGFVTAATSLNGGQPNFARCLAVSCAGILYMHFWGILPLNGILPAAKFSHCVHVLHSPILGALLHCMIFCVKSKYIYVQQTSSADILLLFFTSASMSYWTIPKTLSPATVVTVCHYLS